jgi:hypothetical protein
VLPANEVVCNPPGERTETQQGKHEGRERYGTGAAAAGLLILDDAMRSQHDAAGFFGNGAVATGLLAGEGRKEIGVGA